MGSNGRVKLSVEVTTEADELLKELMKQTNSTTKAEVLRKAIALLKVAVEAKQRNLHLGVAADPANLTQEIVGVVTT